MINGKGSPLTPSCPVCSCSATSISTYFESDVVRKLEQALGHSGLKGSINHDYETFRCSSCTLEFSNPMLEPGAEFYKWLTRSGFAYPDRRWEWLACLKWINSKNFNVEERRCVLLDVGCGDGRFLKLLSETETNTRAIGIDLNPDVISTCQSQGLEAHVRDLEAISDAISEPIDIVTFWHVVEHVADPLKTLANAKRLLSSRGAICFSVPLSPISYEAAWPDPFNAPPHHLTRWNERSLYALSVALDMDIELILPEPETVWRRATRTLLLQAGASQPGLRRAQKLWMLLRSLARNPGLAVAELRRQRRGPMLAGRPRPDVALIVLKPK